MSGKGKKILAGIGGLLVLGGMGYYALHHGGEKNSNNGSSSGSITDVISGGGNSNYFADDPEFPYDWESYWKEGSEKWKNAIREAYGETLENAMEKAIEAVNEHDKVYQFDYSDVNSFTIPFFLYNYDRLEKIFRGVKNPDEALFSLEYTLINEYEYENRHSDSVAFSFPEKTPIPGDIEDYTKRRNKIRRKEVKFVNDLKECIHDYYQKHPEKCEGDCPYEDPDTKYEVDVVITSDKKIVPELVEFFMFDKLHERDYLERSEYYNTMRFGFPFGEKENEKYLGYAIDQKGTGIVENGTKEGIESCINALNDLKEIDKFACSIRDTSCQRRLIEAGRRGLIYYMSYDTQDQVINEDELDFKFNLEDWDHYFYNFK